MKIPVVRRCCCGCLSNRSGSIVIAILSLVYHSISLITSVAFLADGVEWTSWHGDRHAEYISKETLEKIPIVNTVFTVVWIVVDSLLVHGIVKMKRKLIIPWLWVNTLLLILLTSLAVIVIIIVLVVSPKDFPLLVILVIACAIGFSIQIHFLLVVYSHYKELGNMARAEDKTFHHQENVLFNGLQPSAPIYPQ